VDVTASLETQADRERLLELVADLGTYPDWLDIVPRAVPAASDPGDPGPAWSVDLRAQVGPLRRSKRLRMVRHDDPSGTASVGTVVFERRELDDRSHSPWVLTAVVRDALDEPEGSVLEMRLHYGGTLWVPMLDRLLADEIERSRVRLLQVLEVRR
jgi:hypothetical protein